ncbi:transport protein particle complex subunit [Spathaspora passalidarum NRRL Y-27907]|uniref:Trafficking protein particle complex subunit n=1 Tax=Spathaspora passalidarum (strain NRRL Y-27907 / 11-Y1) TaxID=619300 RepID=G3AII8_SPAPN|nr:transport protein particle complex subunit [Spathaspora passalidarum NRRL Y-27907]EGW33703.1 transport protein particle complex subunit [Spathaspora passalidarum NRRL Y-27907]
MSEDIILPSATSLSKLTIHDTSKTGFGYNPAIGPISNSITSETSSILINKRTITLSSAPSIYERNITNKKPVEINLSSLSFLFCEIVNWTHGQSRGIHDLEMKLNKLGYSIGQRYLELIKLRDGIKLNKRDLKIIDILHFIHGSFWKSIFGKHANELEKSQDVPNEYMIIENMPLLAKFINIPKDYADLNCGAFVAGIIEGALDSAGFYVNVTAHSVPMDGFPLRTVFLMKFDQSCLIRESIH